MKEIIKIDFSDFSDGISKQNNFIYNTLIQKYDVQISAQPDILFFSCFGMNYLKYKNCKKVFWAGENLRPDFNGADYCITFDYNNNPNHYRYPLWVLSIIENDLVKIPTIEEVNEIVKSKNKFCAMLVSYCRASKRKELFNFISNNYKRIDSGGRCLNNMNNQPIDNPLDFFNPYKFSLCFENSSHPGYSTEKIINAFRSNCIPLYWGDPELKNELNPKRYISLHDFPNERAFLDYIIEVDNNDDLYKGILKEPLLINGNIPPAYKKENFEQFLDKIITDRMPPNKTNLQKVKHFMGNYYFKYKWDRTWGF